MLNSIAIWYLASVAALSPLLNYIEYRQWWTLRLRSACLIPWFTLSVLAFAACCKLVHHATDRLNGHPTALQLLLAISSLSLFSASILLLAPLALNRNYIQLRWQAWSGPSRTGVPAHLTKYLGDERDWHSLDDFAQDIDTSVHPVEAFLRVLSPGNAGIRQDMTTLLTTRLASDEDADTIWLPRSDAKAGAYAPSNPEQSTSVLWGAALGFVPRCSRGILAVPPSYLRDQPRLSNGIRANALCLAQGILARNKGPQPHRLVCHLETKMSFRVFEENSILWPRPSKTLRSIFHKEMLLSFSGLGSMYVTAATELALLIADTPDTTLVDWLHGTMEHQDLALNQEVAVLAASEEELGRLYRGHYAAMLVSLSLHRPGIRIRPELSIFKALCDHEGVTTTPVWLNQQRMELRQGQEEDVLGARGVQLIEAII